MTTKHHDNAATWRDLADQLTPEQVAELEYCEREGIPPGLASPQSHLNHARSLIERNLAQALCADIAPPTDAVDEPSHWEGWGDGYARMYSAAPTRGGGKWTVDVFGVQFDDGHIERSASVNVEDDPMTAGEIRQLAAALCEAADALEGRR